MINNFCMEIDSSQSEMKFPDFEGIHGALGSSFALRAMKKKWEEIQGFGSEGGGMNEISYCTRTIEIPSHSFQGAQELPKVPQKSFL